MLVLNLGDKLMTPAEVKSYYCSTRNFANLTGMTANTLSNWLRWGYIPVSAQKKIEKLTKGKLKTDLAKEAQIISRHEKAIARLQEEIMKLKSSKETR